MALPADCRLPVAEDSATPLESRKGDNDNAEETYADENTTDASTASHTTEPSHVELGLYQAATGNQHPKLSTRQSLELCWVLLHHKEVWAIIICQFCLGWPQFSVISWLPRIIQDMHQIALADLPLLISLPVLVQGLVGVICGPIGDGLIHRWGWSRPTVRHCFQSLAMIPPAILLLLAYYTSNAMQVGQLPCLV